MAVRSRRLWGPLGITTAVHTTLYTVPAGRTLIVRTICLTNYSATDTVTWNLLVGGASANRTLFGVQSLAPGASITKEVWFALNPGEQLGVTTAGTNPRLTTLGFGSLLLGEPE